MLLLISKNIKPLQELQRVRDLSVAADNTSIGFKMRETLRLESDSFSVSKFWAVSVNMKFSITYGIIGLFGSQKSC